MNDQFQELQDVEAATPTVATARDIYASAGWDVEARQAAFDRMLDQVRADAVKESQKSHTTMWLNAFSCIRPTDEFARSLGLEVIGMVMQSPKPEGVFRKHSITITAS